MNAISSIKSLQLTRQTGLSVVLGGLFALSPLFADFGGSSLAVTSAIVLGVLAMVVAGAEAAGSPRFKNHGWNLAAIAVVILITPWIFALTAVGQILGVFSVAALALGAAATWRIVTTSEVTVPKTGDATPKTEQITDGSTVAEADHAKKETIDASQGERAPTTSPSRDQSSNKAPSAKQDHWSENKDGEAVRPEQTKVNGSDQNGKEVQQADDHNDHDPGKTDPKPPADIAAIKVGMSKEKKQAKPGISEPASP